MNDFIFSFLSRAEIYLYYGHPIYPQLHEEGYARVFLCMYRVHIFAIDVFFEQCITGTAELAHTTRT